MSEPKSPKHFEGILAEKEMKTKKAFTLIELLIVIAIIGILAGVIIVNMANARQQARDAKYIAYVKQVSDLVQKANAMGYFNGITTANWRCLGSYAGNCWGSYVSDPAVDDVLSRLTNSIPQGEPVPGNTANAGTLIFINATTITVTAFASENGAFNPKLCLPGWTPYPASGSYRCDLVINK
ncbi:MAG TPA: type II secretion system protein [Patescibacteria group bacterium]